MPCGRAGEVESDEQGHEWAQAADCQGQVGRDAREQCVRCRFAWRGTWTQVLEWLWRNTSRARFEYPVAALDNCTSLDVLDWWLSKSKVEECGLDWLKYSEDAVDNACRLGRLDVVQWWWNAAVADGIAFLYSRKSVDQACEYGHSDVLDWWLARLGEGSIPDLEYSPASIVRAVANNQGHILDWFARNAIPIRYNPRAKISHMSQGTPLLQLPTTSKPQQQRRSSTQPLPLAPSPTTVARTRIVEMLGNARRMWQDPRLPSNVAFSLTRVQLLHERAQMAATASASNIALKSTKSNKRQFGMTLSANTTPMPSPRSRTLTLAPEPMTSMASTAPLVSPERTSSQRQRQKKRE
ncbi:hypothetical protein BCR44DRAFT_43372 [Catenaria anguillulae PL171]|uniref:Ankyrin repeat-containing domain protein n=1 Tax=Catenaria anguillulae PL171 TaxID=765915 RepID=A0A1Y2HHQ3_9FUNG|nr:hypothetical protein BCR44DRAFT_43372 [Catenaria anguillulae PL171]